MLDPLMPELNGGVVRIPGPEGTRDDADRQGDLKNGIACSDGKVDGKRSPRWAGPPFLCGLRGRVVEGGGARDKEQHVRVGPRLLP